jgi:hypothetical protein
VIGGIVVDACAGLYIGDPSAETALVAIVLSALFAAVVEVILWRRKA